MRLIKISLLIIFFAFNSLLWANTPQKGPQGGHLLKQGAITVELLIFERAMPPHFRAYLYENGKLISPKQAVLSVKLTRFNGRKEKIGFVPIDNFLQSQEIISEPHSFDVAVQLQWQDKQFSWHYSTYEGRIKIMPELLKAAEIKLSTAQEKTIKTRLKVYGKIVPNRDTLAPIYARYSGIIKSLTKNLGQEVKKDDTLAVIESNESLQEYTIKSPIAGTVVQKYATNGELAQDTKPIYEIANLANVWADFTLYRKDASLVKPGMQVIVSGDDGNASAVTTLTYISPLGIEDSQTTLARAILPNENRSWLPGMYVNGAIIIKEKKVPVAVALSAIQQMNGQDVVFVQQGNYFEAAPITLGEKDDQWVEVLSGLDAGQHYVSQNSYFLKAEIGKEGASHDH
ncbi:efflux RND transporter periplasmic adaptor subunit [Legionella sp. 16cNR16C]|uniref:efflux RND transporter periplasmic adaptor subunit n=1 Tax=Legionella sp. 16cNR16C TaxID=2905656 RepID=UPI001E290D09|nr:efflux RND transporter periplasmic adaptor subunit [Legionella sp. 16cNR16C]MCE3046455.1 efflux RND transporter periplasmic adaptor subunit [Legionella sp. 16cNR16C]